MSWVQETERRSKKEPKETAAELAECDALFADF